MKASRRPTDETFVLKRLKNHSRLARFQGEIEAARHLQHEGILPIVDSSLDDPAFLVTPFVSGQSLESMPRHGPLESLGLFTCYFIDEDERLTETMEQVGSRFYMAPELESGRAATVTVKADVYSLGKISWNPRLPRTQTAVPKSRSCARRLRTSLGSFASTTIRALKAPSAGSAVTATIDDGEAVSNSKSGTMTMFRVWKGSHS